MEPEGSTTTTTAIFPTTTTPAPTTTTPDEVSECPEGWSRNQTSCYWVVLDNADWFEAYNGCQQLHPSAHLASSGSETENAFIGRMHFNTHFWLGGTDSDVEGNWTWTDGTPFDYTNWYSGEGSDDTGDNCLAINVDNYYRTYWFDLGCFDSHPYICEINLDHR